MGKLLIVLSTLWIDMAMADFDFASNIISAFRPTCRETITDQGEASLATVQQMRSVFQQLKDDPNCILAAQQISAMQNFQETYERYLVYGENQLERRRLQRTIAGYVTMLADPGLRPEDIEFLRGQIINAQSSLIQVRADRGRFDYLISPYAGGASKVVDSVSGFLSTLQAHQGCYNKYPGLISSLIGNTMLGVAPFLEPTASIGMATGGILVHSVGAIIRQLSLGDILEDIQELQQSMAFQCLSESFTNEVCRQEELRHLIEDYKKETNAQDQELNSKFFGIDLQSDELINVDRWLTVVHAGSDITSEGDLINRNRPIKQVEFIKEVIRYLPVYQQIKRREFSRISDASRLTESMAISTELIINIFRGPTVTPSRGPGPIPNLENPIFASRDTGLLIFQLLNPALSAIPFCNEAGQPQRECNSLLDYVNNNLQTDLSISRWDEIIENATSILNDVLQITTDERDEKIIDDAYSVLVFATRDHKGDTNALDGLKSVESYGLKVEKYLIEEGCKGENAHHCDTVEGEKVALFTHPHFGKVVDIKRTRNLNKKVMELLIEGLRPRSVPEEFFPSICRKTAKPDDGDDDGDSDDKKIRSPTDFDRIEPDLNKPFRVNSCITKILKLDDRENQFYFNKIRNIVTYELEARFKNKEMDKYTTRLIYDTEADLIDALQDAYDVAGTDRLTQDAILGGIPRSQNLLIKNLYLFGEEAEDMIMDTLESVKGDEKDDLCFRILPMIKPDDEDFATDFYEHCGTASIVSSDGREVSALYMRDYIYRHRRDWAGDDFYRVRRFPRDRMKRFCAVRNYHRRNRLFELNRGQ